MKPRALDLFCGAGGMTKGLQRAGFHVTGVDLHPQPNYCGDVFVQAEALTFPLEGFDVICASAPCQAFTRYRNNQAHVRQDHPDLIPQTRARLQAWGGPYVIENVEGAPLIDPVRYCGTSFRELEVRRHRIFESNVPLVAPPCDHGRLTDRKYPGSSNRPNGRTVCNVGEYRVPLWQQQLAMGVDWMTLAELSQAIPPAYSEHIGRQLMEVLSMRYDSTWVHPARTTEVRACRAEDCQSKPPHLVLACTLQDGLCRPCAEKRHVGRRTEEPQRPVQLELL